jgi:hypothetical protein
MDDEEGNNLLRNRLESVPRYFQFPNIQDSNWQFLCEHNKSGEIPEIDIAILGPFTVSHDNHANDFIHGRVKKSAKTHHRG